jgi:hypothetical protein
LKKSKKDGRGNKRVSAGSLGVRIDRQLEFEAVFIIGEKMN